MDLLANDFSIEQKEQDKITDTLKESWNTAEHNKYLFDHIKELLKTFADLNGNVNYTPLDFIKEKIT